MGWVNFFPLELGFGFIAFAQFWRRVVCFFLRSSDFDFEGPIYLIFMPLRFWVSQLGSSKNFLGSA